jgi:mannitol 2-dehydrogenase
MFNSRHPAIEADAANPDAPKTVFGLIVAGLRARRAAGIDPFTVMSCDNIPGNGHVTEAAVVGLAELMDPDLAAWIRSRVAFPSGMVDRITPATGERERKSAGEEFGIDDAWPVFCEDFSQWVLEDRFPAGRPALEKVGVTFVDDVEPFELMKIRILNGGHAVIAYPGGLMDIHYAHEAMENDLIRAFLGKVEREEIIPTVPSVPNTDLQDYFRQIERRFANPKIGDTIRRLCLDGSNRQPKFIIPTIADRIDGGEGIKGLALVSALWCRYCAGVTDSGAPIEPNDPSWERLNATAMAARADPMAWLSMTEIYGGTAASEDFRTQFADALKALWNSGTEAVLKRYVAS